jgi:hypothetical protein
LVTYHNPNKPVWAFWDFGHAASGKGDPHSIAFVQEGDGSGFDVFDHWEGNNVSLPRVARDVLLGRGYTYAKQILPHDGGNVNCHTEQTDAQLLEGFGLDRAAGTHQGCRAGCEQHPARSPALPVR